MITIFEGPDGSGKSTAALAYAEATGATYKHWGQVNDPFGEYVGYLADAIPEGSDIVFDRFYQSELVYGPLFRQSERIGKRKWLLESICAGNKAVVVLCMPPVKEIKANIQARSDGADMDGVPDMIDSICFAYVDILGDLPWLLYDYTTCNGSLMDMIAETRSIAYSR